MMLSFVQKLVSSVLQDYMTLLDKPLKIIYIPSREQHLGMDPCTSLPSFLRFHLTASILSSLTFRAFCHSFVCLVCVQVCVQVCGHEHVHQCVSAHEYPHMYM